MAKFITYSNLVRFKHWLDVAFENVAKAFEELEKKIPTKLSELEDDADHRLVTDEEKNAWDSKYDLPSDGIPKTDLSNGVQTSLDNADRALKIDDTHEVENETLILIR